MTGPAFIARYDQELAKADAGLDSYVNAYRIVGLALPEVDNMAGLAAILSEMDPASVVSLVLVAVRRLATADESS